MHFNTAADSGRTEVVMAELLEGVRPSSEAADCENTDALLSALDAARADKDYKKLTELTRRLAELGDAGSLRAYATMLEEGELLPRNLDLAMEYFRRGAELNDPYSAYRYAKLVSRENDDASRFWLIFSAVIGCESAYAEAADEFSRLGFSEAAHYFRHVAALCDHAPSVVALARAHLDGELGESNPSYAKWYMDRLKLPPMYAIKLAYRLRRETAEEPPRPTVKNYTGLLQSLASEAKYSGFVSAFVKLSEILSERGDSEAMTDVGLHYISVGRVDEGLSVLLRACEVGNIRANLKTAELYVMSESVPQNPELAVKYLLRAGELGSGAGYELAADLFSADEFGMRDTERALELYDMASVLGSESAYESAVYIRNKREALYDSAASAENAELAFECFMRSAEMDYPPSWLKAGECLENGLGCKINRHGAYLLYKKSAEHGDPVGIYMLGRCYAHGIGVDRDFKAARELLSRAQRFGESRAHDELYGMYRAKARKTGASAYSSAIRLLHQGKFDDAYECLVIAEKLKHPKAIYTLGCLYEFGVGVTCDKARAYAMYEEAFALRFRDPRARYKVIILKMTRDKH